MKNTAVHSPDYKLLYELSLSIGQSCEVEENAVLFLTKLKDLKGLSNAALWRKSADEYQLISPTNQTFFTSPIISILPEVDNKRLKTTSFWSCSTSCIEEEAFQLLQKGVYAFIRIKDFGILCLYDLQKENPFPDFELSQLLQLLDNFSNTLNACLNLQALEEQQAKKSKDTIGRTEELYQSLFEQGYDGILLYDNRAQKIISANARMAEHLGCKVEDLMQASPFDFLPEIQSNGKPTLELLEINVQKLLKYGRTQFEWEQKKMDGTPFTAEITAFQLKPPNSHQAVIIHRNISAKREAEIALQETEERYRVVFENAFDGIIVFDVDQNIPLSCNPKVLEYFQITEEEFLSATPLDLSPEYQPDGRKSKPKRDEILRTLENQKMLRYEWQHRRRNGVRFDTEVSTFTMPPPNGHLRISILRDITESKKATEALKKSEASLRQTQKLAKIANFEYDYRTKKISWSVEAYDIFGMAQEGGPPSLDFIRNRLIHPHDIPSFDRRMSLVKNEGLEFDLESRHLKANGEVFYTYNQIKVQRENGVVVKMYGALQDITQRYMASKALRRSEARLQEAQQLAKIGSWVYDIEKDDIIWSQETFNIFGMDPRKGEPSFDTYRERLVHPDDVEELFGKSTTAQEEGIPFEVECRQRKITGEQIYTINIGKPVKKNGKIIKLVGTTQDITERKLADQKLQENRQKYDQLFDNMYDAIVVTNKEGKMVDSNKAAQKMLGYNHEELCELLIPDIVHPEDMENSKEYLKKLQTDGYYSDYQGRILRKDGQVVQVQVNSNAIYEEGEIVGSRDIVRDITELKKAEQKREELLAELGQVNKELQDFAYIVSHDLKAPLRAISSLSQWLREDYHDKLGAEGAQQLDLLINRANRMHNFIEAILEYSRIGRIRQKDEWVDLNELIGITEEMLDIPESFSIEIPRKLPPFFGQKVRIGQIFQNLINNAIKYNDKPNGKVTITWKDQDTHYWFAVQDNGPGISDKYYKKIFQIFQTLQSRDIIESTGIGLTIVKRIIQLYEGQISVHSVLGEHTTFEFTLKKH